MPVNKPLFNDDGTPVGISYCQPSGKRQGMLVVTAYSKSKQRHVMQYALGEKDFHETWAAAVNMLATLKDISPDDVPMLISARFAFLGKYGLYLETVKKCLARPCLQDVPQ